MERRRFLKAAAGTAMLPALARVANAQAYPSRPLSLVVFAPAGGAPIGPFTRQKPTGAIACGATAPARPASVRARNHGARWKPPVRGTRSRSPVYVCAGGRRIAMTTIWLSCFVVCGLMAGHVISEIVLKLNRDIQGSILASCLSIPALTFVRQK